MQITYTEGNVDVVFDDEFIQFSKVYIINSDGDKKEFEMKSPEYFFNFFIYINQWYRTKVESPQTQDVGLLALTCYDLKQNFNEVFDNISEIIKRCGKQRDIIIKSAKEKDRLEKDKDDAYWAYLRKYIIKNDGTMDFNKFIREQV